MSLSKGTTEKEDWNMSVYQNVFKRYEKKYLLSSQQFRQMKWLIGDHMAADQFGTHTISNIYYDTDSYELIRASIERPVYKEKLRVRSYGIPKKDDPVFVEIKKKFKGVVYKRRVQMSLREAENYLHLGNPPEKPGQIQQEIDWFKTRYQIEPKVMIAYERTAYFGRADQEIRMTFDQNIRYRDSELDLSKGHYGRPLIEPGQTLMEIKIPGVMPLWLCQILAQLEIYPASFSKYGDCYKHYLIGHIYAKGEQNYA